MWWGKMNFARIVHEPSGMAASADFSRSNVKCLAACRSMLKGKLWHLEHGADQPPATDAQKDIAAFILKQHNT